jgi:integrase
MGETIVAKLTAVTIRALMKTPGKYGDGEGLWLHVRKPGQAQWYLHYGPRSGQRIMSLGNVEHVPLAEARERAAELRKQLADGVDPLQKREQAKATARIEKARATTFAEACNAYIAAHEPSWRNAHHRYQWRTTLNYACEKIGSLPVGAIETDHVLQVLEPIWTVKPETASRLRGRIETVLSYATVRGWRDRAALNPAIWRGHLQLTLPSKRKLRAVKHLAALPWQDAPAFMAKLRARDGYGAHALQFAILTAARSGEIRAARWTEMDLARAVWTVPAERMKAGREHRVPLSEPALAILREMAEVKDGSGLVFLGMKRGVPMSDVTLGAVLRRMGRGDLTVHGFRSTFRDWAGEATHHAREVIEFALAHTVAGKTEGAYWRGDLFEKRQRLMNDWADFLDRMPVEVIRSAFGPTAEPDGTSPAVVR